MIPFVPLSKVFHSFPPIALFEQWPKISDICGKKRKSVEERERREE